MKTNKNTKVSKTLNFDFENVSSDLEEAPANFQQFLNILNRDAPNSFLDESNPPELPRLSKEHLIEPGPCFNHDEYHNSNIDRNFVLN